MPGILGVVVPLVFSTLVCVALAGRRLSLVRLTLSVAVSQVLFHLLFILGAAKRYDRRADRDGELTEYNTRLARINDRDQDPRRDHP